MELSKALLGALLLGIAVESGCCKKDSDLPQPATTTQSDGSTGPGNIAEPQDPCPACGMG